MERVIALIDCNNFYCSCERAFNAALHNRPVLVLSNNDGCVVARSNEARALGIRMGQPVFECQELIEQHQIALFSSNYALYADMSARVLNLAQFTEQGLDTLLSSIAIKDVWGIGSRYRAHLQASRNIFTAKDLKGADEYWIRKRFTVMLQRTVLELRGIACFPVETEPKPKKGIMTAKSFGRPVELLEELEEAVATYTARAVEKLRSHESAASCINVFLMTNLFQQDAPQYTNNLSRLLPFPNSFTPDFLTVALDMVRSIYKPGFRYKKAGVFLSRIVPLEALQVDLFGDFSLEHEANKARLMAMVDFINCWWGQNTIFFGAQGIGRKWKMRQERRSPRYTTQWGEILVVHT